MLDRSGRHWSMASRGMRSPQAHTRVMESLISLDEEQYNAHIGKKSINCRYGY